MTLFQALTALTLVGKVISGFASQQRVNEEGTNYIGAALGSIGPIFMAIILVPAAVGILYLCYQTWSQQEWAWIAGVYFSVAIVIVSLWLLHVLGVFILLGVGALLFFWNGTQTKTWYGR